MVLLCSNFSGFPGFQGHKLRTCQQADGRKGVSQNSNNPPFNSGHFSKIPTRPTPRSRASPPPETPAANVMKASVNNTMAERLAPNPPSGVGIRCTAPN